MKFLPLNMLCQVILKGVILVYIVTNICIDII